MAFSGVLWGHLMRRLILVSLAVGIADLSERRCDSLIVGVRRALGASRVRTVRRRGWMLVA
jgi:hypothetical protein